MNKVMSLLTTLLILSCGNVVLAQNARLLADVPVLRGAELANNRAQSVGLRSLKPETAPRQSSQPPPKSDWLVIALDPQAATSASFLAALKSERYTSTRTVLLFLGDCTAAEPMAAQSTLLWAHFWALAERSALKSLGLLGTPVVVAMNGENRIVWQQAGVPQRVGNLVLRMTDWGGK